MKSDQNRQSVTDRRDECGERGGKGCTSATTAEAGLFFFMICIHEYTSTWHEHIIGARGRQVLNQSASHENVSRGVVVGVCLTVPCRTPSRFCVMPVHLPSTAPPPPVISSCCCQTAKEVIFFCFVCVKSLHHQSLLYLVLGVCTFIFVLKKNVVCCRGYRYNSCI